jgi:hypothetical protein
VTFDFFTILSAIGRQSRPSTLDLRLLPLPYSLALSLPAVSPSNPSNGAATVRVPASLAKNRQAAVREINPELAAELRALMPHDAAPFQLVFTHMVPEVETFKCDLARAGTPFVDELGRRVDRHARRKTFGTALVLNGEHPRVVMETMRHNDMKLTMKLYTDAGQLLVKAASARLP